MCHPKRFVYILKSLTKARTYYVGLTSNMANRLDAHNAGCSPHTREHRPWRRLVVIEFDEEPPAAGTAEAALELIGDLRVDLVRGVCKSARRPR